MLPGTEFFNDDNGLAVFFRFVPGVPGKIEQPPEGRPKSDRVKDFSRVLPGTFSGG